MQGYVVTADGVKSVRLDRLPPDAWRVLTGDADGSDPLARYKDVPWLYRAVDLRAGTLAGLPFGWQRGGEDVLDNDPGLPFDLDLPALLTVVEAHLVLYGAAYLTKGTNVLGLPREVRALHPTTIKPDIDPRQGLTGFKRHIGGQAQAFKPDDLVYIWLPNFESEVGPGRSPAAVALSSAGLLHNIDAFGSKFFEQGAVMPKFIAVEGANPNDQELERVQSWMERRAVGIKNAFRNLFVRGKLTAVDLGQPLKDLALAELTDKKREDIATALGVPQTLLFSNAANYATARQDTMNLYEHTVLPDAKRIEDALNRQLFAPLGIELKFKPGELEIFQDDEASKADKLSLLFDRGVITRDEFREQMGLEVAEQATSVLALPGGENETKAAEIFGYHIEQGVVTRNEARASLGLPPIEEEDAHRLQDIKAKLSIVQIAVQSGMDLQTALGLVELNVPGHVVEGKSVPLEDRLTDELRRWARMAANRLKEGRPEKMAGFESDVIPGGLMAAIKGGLEAATTPDEVRRVFEDAARWRRYP